MYKQGDPGEKKKKKNLLKACNMYIPEKLIFYFLFF